MRAGLLRHRVRIEVKTETRDAHGGVTEAWDPVATVWASVEALKGEEIFEAQQAQSRVTKRVVMRYRDDVTPQHRLVVVEDDVTLNIESALDPEGRKRRLEILCKDPE